jgi:two-component system, sensor histidine kinase and response regulator
MIGSYDYLTVALSVLIAVTASYAALDLAGRVTATSGWVCSAWWTGGATAMGIGIWAMHFVGMQAFMLPVPVAYHWPTVLMALLVTILASAFALHVVSQHELRPVRAFLGSIIMGGGIAAMHYIGMDAMRLAADGRYDTLLVILSVMLAIVFSLIALLFAFDLRDTIRGTIPRKIASALLMGAAVSVMHYTGMASANFAHTVVSPDFTHAVSISSLGTAGIAAVTLVILGVAIVSSAVDRRFDAQTLELELAEARVELTRVTRIATLSELLASIAHEINQPLAAMVTYGEASLRWLASNPPNLYEVRHALTRAVSEANRVSDVIKTIRALMAKAPHELRPLDINEAIREVMALTHSEASRRGVIVQVELAADAPSVVGDIVQLQQVMINLIMNAIESMIITAEGRRELRIKSQKTSGGVRIEVRDSGEGFHPAHAERLFEPFFTTKPEGMGMGLSVARSIIETHGGRLWVSSAIPKGTVFEFTLPSSDVAPP